MTLLRCADPSLRGPMSARGLSSSRHAKTAMCRSAMCWRTRPMGRRPGCAVAWVCALLQVGGLLCTCMLKIPSPPYIPTIAAHRGPKLFAPGCAREGCGSRRSAQQSGLAVIFPWPQHITVRCLPGHVCLLLPLGWGVGGEGQAEV